MAAPIVYESAGSGGTLFEGKTFWVAQRVPTRSRWIELITANGGEIVLLEKFADIMIADHARKDAPPGTFSWTYIEKSVANGKLEDLMEHCAGPLAGTSRPVGSAQPTRGTRTPFTSADDRALAIWVAMAERQGLSIKGNSIYQQLERVNPRHTYQSWRDRWVKYGQYQPRPTLIADDATPGPVHEQLRREGNLLASSAALPVQRAASSSSRPIRQPRNSQRISRPDPSPRRPTKGQPFTKEDGRLLLEMYDDILNLDEVKMFDAWETWAKKNPQHTAKEWYKFWMEDIKPLRKLKRRKSSNTASSIQSTQAEDREGQIPEAIGLTMPHQSVHEVVAEHPESIQNHIDVDRRHIAEERFEHNLKDFAMDFELEVDFHPTVSGRKIKLFDLWVIVMMPVFGGFLDVDENGKWKEVAILLEFDKLRAHTAATEIRDIYDRMLSDFTELCMTYRDHLEEILKNGAEVPEEQMADYQLLMLPSEKQKRSLEREFGDENHDDLEIPSSPPQRRKSPNGKRIRLPKSDDANQASPSNHHVSTPYKRQRVDKGKSKVLEIPTTPEDRFEFQEHALQIPSNKVQIATRRQQEYETPDLSDDGEGMFVKSTPRRNRNIMDYSAPDKKLSSKVVELEPETQDFHYSVPAEKSNTKSLPHRIPDIVSGGDEVIVTVDGSNREDSSTQSQTDSQGEIAELKAYVDHHISLGYSEEVVTQALLATTMETGDAATVMEAIMAGSSIPANIEGVWTEADDRAVKLFGNNGEYKRVVAKHGEARCVNRRQFLNEEALKELAKK